MSKALWVAPFLLIIASCQNPDSAAPEIAVLAVNGFSSSPQWINASEELEVRVAVNDDYSLQDLRLSVTENTANQDTLAPFTKNIGEWSEVEFRSVSGQEASEEFVFTVPQTVKGEWTVSAAVIDEAGRESEEAALELWILNDIIPSIGVFGAEPEIRDGVIIASTGQTITFDGSVEATAPLLSVGYLLLDSSDETLWVSNYLAGGVTNFSLNDQPYTVPQGFEGTYTLRIEAVDQEFRVNCMDVILHVNP